MSNITITIPSPILIGSAYFKVRYRLLPSGTFSAFTNRTNAPFTLTGLATGNYELEVIYVKEDGTECPASYQYFEVKPEFSCVTFNAQIVASNGLYYLEITYTAPPVSPPCGWRIEYVNGGPLKTVTYTTLPTSNVIRIPVANKSTFLKITAQLCDGEEKVCGEFDVFPIETPCVPFANLRGVIVPAPQSRYSHAISIWHDQSSPGTPFYDIVYKQLGTPANPGQQLHSGHFQYPSVPIVYNNPRVDWVINPVPVYEENVVFEVRLRDICNVWHTIIVTYP